MKKRAAEIIRIITVPPVLVLAMLLILYRRLGDAFGSWTEFVGAVIFLFVIPVCAYPAAQMIGGGAKGRRENQRNMAFAISLCSYSAGVVFGIVKNVPGPLMYIFSSYFLAALILTGINKGAGIRASGHACSCVLPYLIISYRLGVRAALVCVILYAVEFWASIELKRHTVSEFLIGSAVAAVVFGIASIGFGLL